MTYMQRPVTECIQKLLDTEKNYAFFRDDLNLGWKQALEWVLRFDEEGDSLPRPDIVSCARTREEVKL